MVKIFSLELDVDLPVLLNLRSGHLSCLYGNGDLRSIKLGENELLRMIYGAVRDKHWQTVPYTITDEVIEKAETDFKITYTANYRLYDINYRANVKIEGSAHGVISFIMDGIALSSFKRNRIGICLHHPINACAGKRIKITDKSEGVYTSVFPRLISPHQPFTNIRAIEYEVTNDVYLQIKFEGEIFETEDQRNWTDSSYKTYSTPLTLPFPVLVNNTDRLRQSVELTLNNKNSNPHKPTANRSKIEIKIPFPKIGYARPTGSGYLTKEEAELLKQIPFDHYRVEVYLNENSWQKELKEALSEIEELNTRLELVVVFDETFDNGINSLLETLKGYEVSIWSILILQKMHKVTERSVFKKVSGLLRKRLPNVKIGYGTNANFAELNRDLPHDLNIDFVSFSMNPQVHLSDSLSLIENLESQSHLIETLNYQLPGIEIHVSPITLNQRFNPEAMSGTLNAELLPADDRQYTSFAAMWTLQTIKNLSSASCLTLYQTIGNRGLISYDNAGGIQLSAIYAALCEIKSFAPKHFVTNSSVQGSFYDDLVLENESGERLIFQLKS